MKTLHTKGILPAREAAETRLRLFVVRQGQNGQDQNMDWLLTEKDTNLCLGMPPGFQVNFLFWELEGGVGAEKERLWRTGILNWEFGQTGIAIGPMDQQAVARPNLPPQDHFWGSQSLSLPLKLPPTWAIELKAPIGLSAPIQIRIHLFGE